jgi:endoglucanase
VDYTYPTHDEIDYYAGKKANLVRIPFRWPRMQPTLYGALSSAELGRLDDIVGYATGKGVVVLIDAHDYGRWNDQVVGLDVPSATLADFWSKLAGHYASNPRVFFGLMNEPHDETASVWLDAANAALGAIRNAGATNLVTVPGTAWTGAHDWVSSGNATAMLGVVDPKDNYVFEVHQYMDSDFSGSHDTCQSTTVGSANLTEFTAWARANGKRAVLGEFAGGRNATCLAALDDMLSYVDANRDVWLAWTYWGAGPWWGPDYAFSLDPVNGADRPQMGPLSKHLPPP